MCANTKERPHKRDAFLNNRIVKKECAISRAFIYNER